jgi:hypothetical protein
VAPSLDVLMVTRFSGVAARPIVNAVFAAARGPAPCPVPAHPL